MRVMELEASTEGATAADIMCRDVQTIGPDVPIIEAARILSKSKTRHLVVVDEKRRPLRIVSLRDLLKCCDGESISSSRDRLKPVSELVQNEPVMVTPDTTLDVINRLLRAVGCVPIVDDRGGVQGIVDRQLALSFAALGPPQKSQEGEFEFFQPGAAAPRRRNRPAYIRRATGSLALPIDSLDEKAKQWTYARLGYDPASGRIAVQMLMAAGPGVLKIKHARLHDGHYMVIDANDFVEHFKVNFEGRAYTIGGEGDHYVLTPR